MPANEWRRREQFEGTEHTEEAWLACPAPDRLLYRVRKLEEHERKMRLLACAFCRLVWHNLVHPESKAAIEAAERFADGALSLDEFLNVPAGPVPAEWRGGAPARGDLHRRAAYVEYLSATAASSATRVEIEDGWPFWEHLFDIMHWTVEVGEHQAFGLDATATEAAQCVLVRDIFANPYRPLLVEPAWLAPLVIELAQASFENAIASSGHLELARLAVLSDALEEAGCSDAHILSHLRSPGPHVRGCWALDLILGRE